MKQCIKNLAQMGFVKVPRINKPTETENGLVADAGWWEEEMRSGYLMGTLLV